jgi:hypothetical protein
LGSGSAAFSGFGLLAIDVVAKPRAGFAVGFFFLAIWF